MRTSARLQTLVTAVLLLPVGAPAAEPELAERCRGPEHRAFDFWVGNWQVRNAAGDLVGYNDVRRVVDGCGLLESWRGVSGGTGMSINTYDADRGKWTQRWVGAGASLWLEGGVEDGRMVLAGMAPRNTPDGEVLDRLTWTPLPDGRVRQAWEISTDRSNGWREIFVGFYSRSEDAASSALREMR